MRKEQKRGLYLRVCSCGARACVLSVQKRRAQVSGSNCSGETAGAAAELAISGVLRSDCLSSLPLLPLWLLSSAALRRVQLTE